MQKRVRVMRVLTLQAGRRDQIGSLGRRRESLWRGLTSCLNDSAVSLYNIFSLLNANSNSLMMSPWDLSVNQDSSSREKPQLYK